MAAGRAGDVASANPFAVPGAANDPPSFEEVTATMNRMVDSITLLQNQFALLSEDPDVFLQRSPDASTGESGPAVRALRFAHSQERDRSRIRELEAQMARVITGLDAHDNTVALLMEELSDDRNKMEAMNSDINTLRSGRGGGSATAPPSRAQLTGMRGFDKLRPYMGASHEWKEWRIKLENWLDQYSPSYETLIVKLDYSEVEPTESTDGLTRKAGEAEITTEEERSSDQLDHLLVQILSLVHI